MHLGHTSVAVKTGRAIKSATCERCGTEYFYDLRRVIVSERWGGTADAAEKRTQEAATARLQRTMDHDTDVVPCPQCGWIQTEMVHDLRRRSYRWLLGLALIPSGLVLVGCMVLSGLLLYVGTSQATWKSLGFVALVAGAFALAGVALHWLLQRPINPNRAFPAWPVVPVGTPLALLADGPPDEQGRLRLKPAESPVREWANGWITLNLVGQDPPPVCSCCLGPADKVFATAAAGGEVPLRIPVCRACFSRFQRRRLLWGMIALALTASAVMPAFWLIPSLDWWSLDSWSRVVLGVLSTFLVSVLTAVVLPHRLLRPYRRRTIDRLRGVVQVRFANADYARRVAERIARDASDGIWTDAGQVRSGRTNGTLPDTDIHQDTHSGLSTQHSP
ncbi:MAG: hypothetical protein ACHRHE_15580 [Tepidisphaerales bacterium]